MKKKEIKELSDIELTKELKKMELDADSSKREWKKLEWMFLELIKRKRL